MLLIKCSNVKITQTYNDEMNSHINLIMIFLFSTAYEILGKFIFNNHTKK